MIRFRHIDPATEDNTWVYNPQSRRLRRQSPEILTDALGGLPGFSGSALGANDHVAPAVVSTIDPDSYFGFSAKIEDYNYLRFAIRNDDSPLCG
jgi:hypothetical protein